MNFPNAFCRKGILTSACPALSRPLQEAHRGRPARAFRRSGGGERNAGMTRAPMRRRLGAAGSGRTDNERSDAPGAGVAVVPGGAHRAHRGGGRRHAAHGFGPLHRRVAAGDRRDPAALRRSLAGGVRGLPRDPTVRGAEPRDDARGIQGALLVGVDAPATRAARRRRLPRSVHRSSGGAGSSTGRSPGSSARCSCSAACKARSAGGWWPRASPSAPT